MNLFDIPDTINLCCYGVVNMGIINVIGCQGITGDKRSAEEQNPVCTDLDAAGVGHGKCATKDSQPLTFVSRSSYLLIPSPYQVS